MTGTGMFAKKNSTLRIALNDEKGNAAFARSVGTPPSTAGLFSVGALCVDTTNALLYINTGTVASPTWTKVGLQT